MTSCFNAFFSVQDKSIVRVWVRGGEGCCDCLSHSFGQSGEEPGNKVQAEPPKGTPRSLSTLPDPRSMGLSLGFGGQRGANSPAFSTIVVYPVITTRHRTWGGGASLRPLFCRRKTETWTRALTWSRSQSWKVREGHTLQPGPGPMYPLQALLPWDTENTLRKHRTLLSFKYLKERKAPAFSLPATCKLDTGDEAKLRQTARHRRPYCAVFFSVHHLDLWEGPGTWDQRLPLGHRTCQTRDRGDRKAFSGMLFCTF